MKTHIFKFVVALSLLAFAPGCSLFSGKSPVTWEASRYLSFRDCWTVTLAIYDAHMDRRYAGKVTAEDARDIDAAWNTFRAAYSLALASAAGNELAFTPDNVKTLANDVLTLIYAQQ